MSTELTPVQQQAVQLREYLNADRIKAQIIAALPKWLSPDRFLRVIFGAALRNPKLMECSMESILQAVMMCAQLGLEPILGRAYLVPYWNGKKRCLECQFQPGYQGLTDLARRSGMINDVYAQVVYENDFFDIEYGTSRKIVHKPCLTGEPGNPIGSYCVWEFKDGTKSFEFMPTHEINKRRDKSQSFNFAETGDPQKGGGKRDSIWHEWAADMMRKTVVKHSSKLVPSSIEFMEAVMVDDAADTGRRVTMVQGVPMIENGLGASPLELKAPEHEEIFSEAFIKYAGLDYFEQFVAATMQANRCSRNEIVKAANQNPEAFIQTLTAWLKKRNGNGGEAVPPVEAEQGESDSGKPKRTYTRRAKAEPPQAQEITTESVPQDPEAAELEAVKKIISQRERENVAYALQARRNTGIALATTLDGATRLLDEIERLIAERPPK